MYMYIYNNLYFQSRGVQTGLKPRLEKQQRSDAQLSERLATLGIVGVPLKPLNTIVL